MTETRQSRIQSFAFVISGCVCVLFSIYFVISIFAVSGQPCEIQLEQVINPNNAPVASLARLPGIGRVRAQAIVAYRESFLEENRNDLAFRNYNDLQKVSGIGPKTAQNINKWLRFE